MTIGWGASTSTSSPPFGRRGQSCPTCWSEEGSHCQGMFGVCQSQTRAVAAAARRRRFSPGSLRGRPARRGRLRRQCRRWGRGRRGRRRRRGGRRRGCCRRVSRRRCVRRGRGWSRRGRTRREGEGHSHLAVAGLEAGLEHGAGRAGAAAAAAATSATGPGVVAVGRASAATAAEGATAPAPARAGDGTPAALSAGLPGAGPAVRLAARHQRSPTWRRPHPGWNRRWRHCHCRRAGRPRRRCRRPEARRLGLK